MRMTSLSAALLLWMMFGVHPAPAGAIPDTNVLSKQRHQHLKQQRQQQTLRTLQFGEGEDWQDQNPFDMTIGSGGGGGSSSDNGGGYQSQPTFDCPDNVPYHIYCLDLTLTVCYCVPESAVDQPPGGPCSVVMPNNVTLEIDCNSFDAIYSSLAPSMSPQPSVSPNPTHAPTVSPTGCSPPLAFVCADGFGGSDCFCQMVTMLSMSCQNAQGVIVFCDSGEPVGNQSTTQCFAFLPPPFPGNVEVNCTTFEAIYETPSPTSAPTLSFAPTMFPTETPTTSPTQLPTPSPSTDTPTIAPTQVPTLSPTTKAPTVSPTAYPTALPTTSPTTAMPVLGPLDIGPAVVESLELMNGSPYKLRLSYWYGFSLGLPTTPSIEFYATATPQVYGSPIFDATLACPSRNPSATLLLNDVLESSPLAFASVHLETQQAHVYTLFSLSSNVNAQSPVYVGSDRFLVCARLVLYDDDNNIQSFQDTALLIQLDGSVHVAVDTIDVVAGAVAQQETSQTVYSVEASFCGDHVDPLALTHGDKVRICLKVQEYPNGFLTSCRSLQFTNVERGLTQQILQDDGSILPGLEGSIVTQLPADDNCQNHECLSYNVVMYQMFALSTSTPTTVTLEGICDVQVGTGRRRRAALRGLLEQVYKAPVHKATFQFQAAATEP